MNTPFAQAPAPRPWLVPAWWLAIGLGILTLLLYWPATHADFINYDDPDYVTTNPAVLGGLTLNHIAWAFTTSDTANWHPLTWLSLMLDATLFGPQSAGFHFTNVALHALNAVLLFGLLLRLTGARWRSALVAALFAWHPLHVESVAWVAERKDVLSTCLGFLALWFYLGYTKSRDGSALPAGRSRVFYGLSLLVYALGLLSKPMVVTWPCVWLLLDFWPLNRFQPGRAWPLVREKIPFFALAGAASVVTFLVQHHGGALADLAGVPFDLRLENALISYVRYLEKLFWPSGLAVFYPYPPSWPLALALLAAVALAGVTTLFWIRRRHEPFLLVGWLWFVGMLVPVIGLVQAGQQSLADRYTYLPSVGLLILLVWGAHALTRRSRPAILLAGVVAAASLVLCLVLTRQQLACWQNSETLFRHALAVTQSNYIAHNHLGIYLFDQGHTDAAIQEYQSALDLQPTDAEAHNNLGVALARQGRTDDALTHYQTALRLKPGYAEVHYNLANLLARLGKTDTAITEFSAAIRLKPDQVTAHNNLGVLLNNQGQVDAAISEFATALHLDPHDADAHYNLGNAFLKQGQIARAITEFQAALQGQPDYAPAHYNLGVALSQQGPTDAAISEFQAALRLKPDYAIAHNHLGIALAQQGRLDEAIHEFQAAIRFKPAYASAQTNLARAQELKNQSVTQHSAPAQ